LLMRIRTLVLAVFVLSWVPPMASGLDFSSYRSKEVDWKDAAIAEPPRAVKDQLGGKSVKRKVLKRTIVISKPGVYDFKNLVHVAKFSSKCDQTEGRKPMLHVKSGGVTIRNWIGVGTGHDGIHVHSGSGQGWKSRSVLKGVRFERCWQQACEDALTIGFKTRDIRFDRCGFIPNPKGEYRDKLAQLNHADGVLFSRCYFGPTKNGIEFKSGAKLTIRETVFDHCSTGLRVKTSDKYGGIKANQPTLLRTEKCRFHKCHHPAYLDGTVRWESRGDEFERTMRVISKNGAEWDKRKG
jgi:hypothetical protein